MELTHFLHPLKHYPLLAFVVLGTLLFGARRLLLTSEPAPVPLLVTVPAGASPAEVQRATEKAMLLAFAVRAGFVRSDEAVRDRLVQNVRFVDDTMDDRAALAQAMQLGMHRTDPVARQRLIWLATETLAATTRVEPSDAELNAYLQKHAERYRRPARISFEQVFVSRERHGTAFEARVETVGKAPREALSDPGLLPARMTAASPARIDAHFGEGFAARLPNDGEWSKPLSSPFGVHFVRVLSRSAGTLPTLDQIRARVRHELERDTESQRVRDALERMRAAYRVRVEAS